MTQEARREGSEQEPQPTSRYIVPLNSLGSDQYELKRPIGVLIEEYGDNDDVMARLPEVGQYGHGATEDLAIEDLVEITIDYFGVLEGTPDDGLGPLPLKHKARLTRLIGKADQ